MMKYVIIILLFSCCSSTSIVVNGQRIETKKRVNDTEIKTLSLYIFALIICWNIPINNPLHK